MSSDGLTGIKEAAGSSREVAKFTVSAEAGRRTCVGPTGLLVHPKIRDQDHEMT